MLPCTRVILFHQYLDAKRHASLLSNILLDNSSYLGVNGIISFQKLVVNLDKMTTINLGRQHQRSLDFYSKSFENIYICLEL